MAKVKHQFSGEIRGLDARPDRVDFRDREYRPPLRSLIPEYPPPQRVEEFLPQYLEDDMVLNQGAEGACTGFGLAAVINYIYWEQYKQYEKAGAAKPKRVSPRMLYNNARLYDEWEGEDYEGSSCRGGMKGWHKHGVCTEDLFVYDENRFHPPLPGWAEDAINRPLGAYYRVDALSIVDMQAAIHETHAVYASAKVHDGWSVGKQDAIGAAVISQGERDIIGGHAFALVGYNRHGFIVQNSWGGDWGFKGFGLLPYDDWVRNGFDAWVAAIGAPVAPADKREEPSATPMAKADVPLVAQSGVAERLQGPLQPSAAAQVRDWTDAEAYRHAVVTGNEGRMLRRLQDAADAEHNLELIFEDAGNAIEHGCRHLVFYAHGGLTDEASAMRHVRRLGPYLKANGIHPIFFVWKTGIVESLGHIGGDYLEAFRKELEAMRSKGFVEDIIDTFREKRDRTFELAARRFVGRPVWSEIKQNAAAAATGDGTIRRVTGHLRTLRNRHEDLSVHMIGHSAGSIWLGHMAEDLRQAHMGDDDSPPVDTVTLWAPACTTAFAVRHFGNAFKAGVIAQGGLQVDVLSDERERADSVHGEQLYGKSILYLVSRALEDAHKTPLLGLRLTWPAKIDEAFEKDIFARSARADVDAWAETADRAGVVLKEHRKSETSNGVRKIPVSHTSFDNDVEVNMATMERILGRKPKARIRNLATN